jgi:hypothetical protein
MIRFLVPLFALLVCLTSQAVDAHACACRNQVPAVLVAQADQIVLVRTVGETPLREGYRTDFEVLHTLKGEAMKTFHWVRKEENPLCQSTYQVGEITLLFVHDGDLPACVGNEYFSGRVAEFSKYLRSAGQKSRPLTLDEIEAALEPTLKGYLHKRPEVIAYYDPLAGEKLQIGDTQIRFRKAGKWKENGDDWPVNSIVVVDATRWRDVVSLNAIYLKEGLVIRILLQDIGEGFTVLFRDVSER